MDTLVERVFPDHFGLGVDETARRRIMDVSKVYSKSKGGNKDWIEDSEAKDEHSTPEIRQASERYLSGSYTELKEYGIK